MRASAWLLASLLACGCGSEKSAKPDEDPGTLDKLVECNKERERAKTARDMCTKQLDEERARPAGQELTVRLEGDILRVYGELRQAGMAAGDATKMSEAMISQVRASRAAIQLCYVAALKKNEALQGRTVNGKVYVAVSKEGSVTSTTFNPAISGDFNACLLRVASRWRVPVTQASTFEVPVTLQPTE